MKQKRNMQTQSEEAEEEEKRRLDEGGKDEEEEENNSNMSIIIKIQKIFQGVRISINLVPWWSGESIS